jgi:hypothetical protein
VLFKIKILKMKIINIPLKAFISKVKNVLLIILSHFIFQTHFENNLI